MRQSNEEDLLKRLLHLAGPRPLPPEQMRSEVKEQVHRVWQKRVRRRRWMRTSAAVAATLLVAVIGVSVLDPVGTSPPPEVVGKVLKVAGTLIRVDGENARLSARSPLYRNGIVQSSTDGGVSLRLSNGASLRLGPATRVKLMSGFVLELQMGKLYLDTVDARPNVQFEVQTAFGTIKDIGTQFEVQTQTESVRVRVRDGEVFLETHSTAHHASRGEALEADVTGNVVLSSFSPVHADWNWVIDFTPQFETDNAKVADLIAWAARETGRTVVYSDALTRNRASLTRIHGSITNRSPIDTMITALSATRFNVSVEHESMVVSHPGD